MTTRLAVLASGGGRTFANLLERSRDGRLPAELVLLGVSKARCGARDKAEAAGIPCFVRGRRRGEDALTRSQDIFARLDEAGAELLALAGYLQLLRIPERWRGRVINIHPSLIPAFSGHGFYGMRVHEAAWAAGVTVGGCTVHYCDDIYDHGPIIHQQAVDLRGARGPEEIAARVFAAEREAYPEALGWACRGELRIVDGRVVREA